MATDYSPSKVDLFFPARRGQWFCGVPLEDEAAICAEMTRLAYCRTEPAFSFDKAAIKAALDAVDFTAQFFESKGTPEGVGTHCLLAQRKDGELAIAAFRGTDAIDPTDLFADGDVLQMDWPQGGRVHAGFAHALAYVQEDLLAALEGVRSRVLYAGHSLGAALATLLASLRKPDHLYTIGCPRVGDADFVRTLAVEASRYVDCCDVVTRIPPEVVPGCGTYAHLGPPLYIARDRAIHLDPADAFVAQDQVCAAADYVLQFGWKVGNAPVRDLADHAPINYVWALSGAVSG